MIVARHYNVSKADLLSSRRTRTIVRPRQIAMYLAKVLTPRSLPEIGRRFGGRDHTTVLHAVRKIEGLIGDKTLADEIELLKRSWSTNAKKRPLRGRHDLRRQRCGSAVAAATLKSAPAGSFPVPAAGRQKRRAAAPPRFRSRSLHRRADSPCARPSSDRIS